MPNSYSPPSLPTYYYLDNFESVVNAWQSVYGEKFDSETSTWLKIYLEMPRDEKCLVVRAFSRKRESFHLSLFDYSEIANAGAAFQSLISKGVFRKINSLDLPDLAAEQTKSDLIKLATLSGIKVKASEKKQRIVETLLCQLDKLDSEAVARLGFRFQWQNRIKLLFFMHFGEPSRGLSDLALRDLRIYKTNRHKTNLEPKFASITLAKTALFFATLETQLQKDFDLPSIAEWPSPENEEQATIRNRCISSLAKKSFSDVEKIETLTHANGHPARLELVRLLLKVGKQDTARLVLEDILASPSDGTELIEAENILMRKYGEEKLNQITKLLREAETVSIDEAYLGKPERGLSSVLREQGYDVDRAENNLWTGFFTLLFWDLLFGKLSRGVTSEFSSMPVSIRDRTFFKEFQEEIEKRLQQIQAKTTGFFLLKNFAENYGKRNPLFLWRRTLLDRIERLRTTADSIALITPLLDLAKDFQANKSGFPDLVAYKEDRLEFIEVKSEGDSLRPNQLYKINKFNECGLDSKIIKTVYQYNPEQIYTVIDIETTGGLRGDHRVTEIGAVRLKGDAIIDEWSTLLNPEKPIPRMITKLTGIDNEMVKDAPLFHEVSDDFKQFLGNSIFVAHNVRFDYGFLQKEFERINEQFRAPTACTVQLSRKHMKGFRSYSLKNLCNELSIDNSNHHRALNDARAAAKILIEVNKIRASSSV